jgi:transcriptional regulator with XRE-family HTH domain
MTIGEKIRELRKAKSWTKQRLADELATHRNTIYWWETGRNEPTIFYCILLADAFNVTLDELCCRGDYNG